MRRGGRVALALLGLLLLGEVAAGWLLWARRGAGGSALLAVARDGLAAAQRAASDRPPGAGGGCVNHAAVLQAVFAPSATRSPEAAAVHAELETRYRTIFEHLLRTVRARGAVLVMLHPRMAGDTEARGAALFTALAHEHDVPLLHPAAPAGMTEADLFLLPVDYHPSRLGHRLMADALLPTLRTLAGQRAAAPAGTAMPRRLGLMPPGLDTILNTVPAYPYRLRTNAQGLRMGDAVPAQAARQVVLLLGDSFTFGTPLNAPDLYAARLAEALPDRLIVNAGMPGTGLEEAAEIFEALWGAARADIVVLQVLDNDIEALLWTASSSWFAPRPRRAPTQAERRLQAVLDAACAG